jgi:hypothetical protein
MSAHHPVLCVLSLAVVVAGCASLDERRASIDERRETRSPVLGDPTTPVTSAPIRQHIGTVASVDARARTIRLTHGPVVYVSPSTKMRFGTEGRAIALGDLRPGDKVIFNVLAADATASTRGAERVRRDGSTDAAGSALPREVTGLATPGPVVELVAFRPR